MKVIELAFCCYAVTDMERAREFYEGVLHLTPTTVTNNEHGQWTEYELVRTRWPSVVHRDSNRILTAVVPRSKWKTSTLPWLICSSTMSSFGSSHSPRRFAEWR